MSYDRLLAKEAIDNHTFNVDIYMFVRIDIDYEFVLE